MSHLSESPLGHIDHRGFRFFTSTSKGATMFFPFIGISAIAISLTQLGALAVKVAVFKAMLAVAVAIALALLLGLALVFRGNKNTGL